MNNIINFKKNIIKFINKKNIKYILIALFFIVVFIFSQLNTNTTPADFITRDESRQNKIISVVDTFPKNNSISSAHTLSVEFSESILDYDFKITTKPFMQVETTIPSRNPYKIFIIPNDFWDYTTYEITIESDALKEPYILNLTFEEEVVPFINEVI